MIFWTLFENFRKLFRGFYVIFLWKGLPRILLNICIIIRPALFDNKVIHLPQVVQKMDNAIHWINHYPADSVVCFDKTYPLDSDLSSG